MEFFAWLNVSDIIFYYSGTNIPDATYYGILFGIPAGLLLMCLIFGGIGLYTMAKRAGKKHAWLAFLPFANTYYAGVLGGETKVFGAKMKRAGLYAMLAEIAYVALNIFLLVLTFYLDRFYEPTEVFSTSGELIGTRLVLNTDLIPANMLWSVSAVKVLEIVTYPMYLAQLFLFCILYNSVFRKYYARSPFLMTFLCAILPFRGFVLFAVRNNTPIDYEALMRKRMEAYQRAQQARYGNYQPPYSGGQNGGQGGASQDPFDDFHDAGSGTPTNPDSPNDSPFSDF